MKTLILLALTMLNSPLTFAAGTEIWRAAGLKTESVEDLRRALLAAHDVSSVVIEHNPESNTAIITIEPVIGKSIDDKDVRLAGTKVSGIKLTKTED